MERTRPGLNYSWRAPPFTLDANMEGSQPTTQINNSRTIRRILGSAQYRHICVRYAGDSGPER